MSDVTSKKIGTILASDDTGRDAIHIAVVPVVADMDLRPGQHISLQSDGTAVVASVDFGVAAIGIVDPYLRRVVTKGQRVFLFLYPNTITSLRHEWTHPAFEEIVPVPITTTAQRIDSRRRLEEIAVALNLTYLDLMTAAKLWIDEEDYTVQYNSQHWRDEFPQYVVEFWEHYEVVTGTKAKDPTASFFSCSC